MKKTLVVLLFSVTSMSAQAQTKLNLVTSESKLTWKAFHTLVGDGHHGTIDGIVGTLETGANGKIEKGNFTIDMNTLQVLGMETPKGKKGLEDHLKNDDFFSVSTYPKGFFSIISITYSGNTATTLDGFLGIKGISNRISFPIKVESDGKSVRARGTVTIDRTKWNVMYQSKAIGATLKDGLISDDVIIDLDLRFK